MMGVRASSGMWVRESTGVVVTVLAMPFSSTIVLSISFGLFSLCTPRLWRPGVPDCVGAAIVIEAAR